MDDPNITMEEYNRLEEEKAQKCGEVFDWETAKYGKIWYDEDVHDLKFVETEISAIVFNDNLTSNETLFCEPTPTLYPQHIDEFDLKDETSLSEYNEVEQNVLYFNDLFPFHIIYPDDLNSDKDNDDNEIDMIQSSGDKSLYVVSISEYIVSTLTTEDLKAYNLGTDLGQSVFTSRAWRRLFDIRDLLVHELILEFFSTFRFGEAVLNLDTARALQFQLGRVRRRMSWRKFILALGLHSAEEMQTTGFGLYWAKSTRRISNKGDMNAYWIGISSMGDFIGIIPSYTLIRDPILRLCHRLIACSIAGRSQPPEKVTVTDLFYLRRMDIGSVNVPYLLARYLRLFTSGRKQGAMISGDMAKLVGLLCVELDDTWAWGQREVLDNMARDLSRFTTWTVTSLSRMMDRAGVTYTRYSKSSVEYQRRTKQRTDSVSTSAAP
ncbi:hypothetical protein Tco_1317570 [Tanacetum coccineum]